MNYKKYFEDNNLTNIENFFNYTNSKFSYGWMDQDNNFHKGINDADSFCLQYPFELLKSKTGNCWDMTELYRCWFLNMTDLQIETYYLFYDDDMGCFSHSILVFYKDNSIFWFEPMFNDDEFTYSGIHQYSNIQALLKDVRKQFIKYMLIREVIPKKYDDSKIYIYKYMQPKYHINGHQMRDHIDNSILIKNII